MASLQRGAAFTKTAATRLSTVLSRDFWRRHRDVAAYGAFGFVVFIAFLIAHFPYQQAVSTMLEPFNMRITYTGQHLALPLGTELTNVRLVSTGPMGDTLLAESPNLTLAPTFLSLVIGRPGVKLRTRLYDGEVSATAYRRGSLIELDFEASGLNLERYRDPKLETVGTQLRGRLRASGSAMLAGLDPSANSGQLKLTADRLVVKVASGFPSIKIGNLTGTLDLDRGVVHVTDIDGHGADLAVKVQGIVRLMPDLAMSQLDLKLKLDPTPTGRSHLRFLLALLPHSPDAGPYTVRGPILAPSIS
jgi:type II secretion system protein N